ncbi:hypothetical protein [Streptomyces sp. NPDC003435]
MFEPMRREQLPSGQLHGISCNIDSAGNRAHSGVRGMVRLSALLAGFALMWSLVTDTPVDAAESAFMATMLGFTWHAGVQFTWVPRK